MGKQKHLKAYRRNLRKHMRATLQQAHTEFDVMDYIRPRPQWIPQWLWNSIINLIIKK